MCLGIPGKIVSITSTEKKLGLVDVSGVKREINLACILTGLNSIEECVGKWVLVHVGFAMNIINEEEARKTLMVLEELGEAQEEIEKIKHSVKGE